MSDRPDDFVTGEWTGLRIPAHVAALAEGGAAWLTRAFRASGALADDNAVIRIGDIRTCPGGSTGQKYYLDVDYARADPGLHRRLFVKFSRNFDSAFHDHRGQDEMQSEIRFANLARFPDFPVRVPRPYFADIDPGTRTGLLITETVRFGEDGIEPHRPKCRDAAMDDPIAYYRTIFRSLARIAAEHRSGRLGDIDRLFPFDPDAAAVPQKLRHDGAQIRMHIATYADFVARHPRLFPPNLTSAFFARMAGEVDSFVVHQDRINRFQQEEADLIALCHWNAHIDNCWFWRAEAGQLQCGLMDWGRVGQMNLGFALWGCLSGASLAIWDRIDELLTLFASELAAHGGPSIAVARLRLHLQLYMAMMGLSWFIDAAPRIEEALPEVADATGPEDPMFEKSERGRSQLNISRAFVNYWERSDIGSTVYKIGD